MASSILQRADATSIPGGTFNNPIGICHSSATTAGSTHLVLVASAYDSIAQTFTAADTLGNTWTQAQYQSRSGGWNIALFYLQNAPVYPAPTAITFTGTVASSAASATLNAPWAGTTATYIIRFSTGEIRTATLTNGSTSCAWSQGLGGGATASASAGSGPYFSQSGNNGDFTSISMCEVGGVATTGGIVSNSAINLATAIGSNNINPGSLACGSGSGIVVVFANCVGNSAGTPTFTPKVGTSPVSFTLNGSGFWTYGSISALTILESANVSNAGTVTPTAGTQETAADDYYVFGAFLADATQGAAPAALNLSRSGPGVMPGNTANQFRAAPRAPLAPTMALSASFAGLTSYSAGIVSNPLGMSAFGNVSYSGSLNSNPMAIAAGVVAGFTGDLSTSSVKGGLAFIPQSGPGANGPFNNSQFQASPRSANSIPAPFRASFQNGAVWGFSLDLSQLTPYALATGTVVSMSGDLATTAASGGRIGYLPQPGPGASGPFNNNQFQSSPRSTNKSFQTVTASVSAGAQVSMNETLATAILLAFDNPDGQSLVTEGGDPFGIAASSPARGTVSASFLMSAAVNMALAMQATVSASGSLSTNATFSVNFGAQAGAALTLATGITFAANFSGLTYMSSALGGTSLSISAAGLTGVSLSLLTAIPLGLASSSNVGFSSALTSNALGMSAAANTSLAPGITTGISLATNLGAVASATLALSAASALGLQPSGVVSTSFALITGMPLASTSSGVASTSLSLTAATTLAASYGAVGGASMALGTQVAAYAFRAGAVASYTAGFVAPISLMVLANQQVSGNFALMTILQPPGEFADIRWLRAPRGGDVAYAEFFQGVGEQLWYGIVWEDWLASNWEANSSATLAQAIRPTVPNGLELLCITAGQTGAVEPLWANFSGGVTQDGTAQWQAQAVSAVSLDDAISSWNFSAPAGITLDSGQVVSLRSYLIIETPAAVVGTDYDVLATIYTTGGQQKIAKLRIKVR